MSTVITEPSLSLTLGADLTASEADPLESPPVWTAKFRVMWNELSDVLAIPGAAWAVKLEERGVNPALLTSVREATRSRATPRGRDPWVFDRAANGFLAITSPRRILRSEAVFDYSFALRDGGTRTIELSHQVEEVTDPAADMIVYPDVND